MSTILLSFLQYYGIAIFASIFFVTFIRTSKSLGPDTSKYFTYCVIVNILLVLSDFGQSYYEELSYPTTQRMFFASCSYSLRVLVLVFFMYLFHRNKPLKYKLKLTTPGLVNILVSFSAFFTKLTFYYTEDNTLVRGPLISVPFIASLFYFALIVVEIYKNKNNDDNSEAILLILIFTVNTVSTLLEVFFRLKGILPGSIIISITFYYFYFLNDNYSYDQLTGALIRNRLYEDIKSLDLACGIIALDLDDLKIINDTSGHKAGDKALSTISQAIKNTIPSTCSFYRIGGDEFIIIYKTSDLFNVVKLVDEINAAIEETVYSASIGYAIKEVDEDFQKALTRADNDLHDKKMKKKKAERENLAFKN